MALTVSAPELPAFVTEAERVFSGGTAVGGFVEPSEKTEAVSYCFGWPGSGRP